MIKRIKRNYVSQNKQYRYKQYADYHRQIHIAKGEDSVKRRYKRSVYVGFTLIFLMVVFLIYPMEASSQESLMASLNDDKKPKVIYVIYDNSTSMVRDDVEPSQPPRYTTRWVEASYAIKALATMMNDKDILRIYPISGGEKSEEIKFERTPLKKILETIDSEINNLKWKTGTNFSSVEEAVDDLRKNYNDDYEHWVVILTDGAFGDLDGVALQDKLDELNSTSEVKGKPVYFAYIYIAGGGGGEIDEVRESRPYILVPDNASDEITGKMTNIANKIYNRVAIKSPENYIGMEGNDTRIKLDIPLERALVFIQHTGEEKKYDEIEDEITATYENMYLDGGIECSDGLKEDNNYPIAGDSREIKESSFEAAKGDGTDIDQIVYRYIKGNMHVVVPTKTKGDFRKQYIIVKNYTIGDSNSGDSIDIYYKPSVRVGTSYFQEGKEILHTQECLDSRKEGAAEECIPAGELVIQINILANDGDEERLLDYELLYPDDFEVSLKAQSGEEVELYKIGHEELQYSCELEKGEYELQVITSWNATYRQSLVVQDKWQPVAMEFYETDSIYLESSDNPSWEVRIRAFSGGEASDEEVLGHVLTLNLESDNELFDVEELGRQGDDIWRFQVTLNDPSVHDVGETLRLRAVAETDYIQAADNKHVFEADLPITSGDFTISVVGSGTTDGKYVVTAGDYFRRLLGGETIGIDYYCDGIKLTEEQRQGIRAAGEYTVDPEKMQKKIRITGNGNIRLEYAPLYWLWRREDTIYLKWYVTYTRWNTKILQEVVIELGIIYLPLALQIVIVVVTLFMIAWGLLCFCKRFTRCFIPREKVMLVSNFDGQDIRLCRKGMLLLPLWKKARIRYKDSSGYFPDILIDIRVNPEGIGYEILNYAMLGDETKYRLGNGRISENNCIISETKAFSVADQNGIWYKMIFKR